MSELAFAARACPHHLAVSFLSCCLPFHVQLQTRSQPDQQPTHPSPAPPGQVGFRSLFLPFFPSTKGCGGSEKGLDFKVKSLVEHLIREERTFPSSTFLGLSASHIRRLHRHPHPFVLD